MDDFLYEPFYQIMRQRLLADRMVHECELGIDEAKVVVVVPEENWAYRGRLRRQNNHIAAVSSAIPSTANGGRRDASCSEESRCAVRYGDSVPLLDTLCQHLPDETAEWAGYWRDRYGV